MKKPHKVFTQNVQAILLNQVNNICPKCSIPLMYDKNGAKHKRYELAHIYPLNPKPDEFKLLENEKKLNSDVDHPDNIIPLCNNCHEEFDKPRTLDEYRELVSLKETLIKEEKQRYTWHKNELESELSQIIDLLLNENIDIPCEIEFEAKRLEQKLNQDISPISKRRIRQNVEDYYIFIQKKFQYVDTQNPGVTDLILSQVRHYYQQQKKDVVNQYEIFNNICDWIHVKTRRISKNASEIMTSFFIQNCEVF